MNKGNDESLPDYDGRGNLLMASSALTNPDRIVDISFKKIIKKINITILI